MNRSKYTVTLRSQGERWPTLRQVTGIDVIGALIERPMRGEKKATSNLVNYRVGAGLFTANEPSQNGGYACKWFQVSTQSVVEVTEAGFRSLLESSFPEQFSTWELREGVLNVARRAHPKPAAEVTELGKVPISRNIIVRVVPTLSVEQNAARAHIRYSAEVGRKTLTESSEVAIRRAIRACVAQERKRRDQHAEQARGAQVRARKSGLPELTGSKAQVQWATVIRDQVMRSNPKDPRLKRNTTAAFWINNRSALNRPVST